MAEITINELWLPTRAILRRYGIADRTFDRWLKDESFGFPQPDMRRGRRYFRESEIIAWERKRAARNLESCGVRSHRAA